MATGTIDAQEIGNGSGPVTLTKQSAAKAWANLNGTGTIALRDSLNIASVTDEGTGTYLFNLTSSMSNANAPSTVAVAPAYPITTANTNRGGMTSPTSVSTIRVRSLSDGDVNSSDAAYVGISNLGDLAI